jgi:hypothetical protein
LLTVHVFVSVLLVGQFWPSIFKDGHEMMLAKGLAHTLTSKPW